MSLGRDYLYAQPVKYNRVQETVLKKSFITRHDRLHLYDVYLIFMRPIYQPSYSQVHSNTIEPTHKRSLQVCIINIEVANKTPGFSQTAAYATFK